MRTIFDRKRTKLKMIRQEETIEIARPRVQALVDVASRSAGSRMAAYDAVARNINSSASWVRKLLGRQPVSLDASQFLNIILAFEKVAKLLEQEADIERQRYLALKAQHDAEFKSLLSFAPAIPPAVGKEQDSSIPKISGIEKKAES